MNFVQAFCALGLVALTHGYIASAAGAAESQEAASRPNVIVILADDI